MWSTDPAGICVLVVFYISLIINDFSKIKICEVRKPSETAPFIHNKKEEEPRAIPNIAPPSYM